MTSAAPFGMGDSSFQAAGGTVGLERLSRRFYEHMATLPEAAGIRSMHPADLSLSAAKLAAFLSGWLGGPKAYLARFGPISIPAVHEHLKIDEAERDAWMLCMARATRDQPWSEAFKAYFMEAIAHPAERVRVTSVARRAR